MSEPEAMQIAEDAREKESKHPSFASQLFMGQFDRSLIFPFPKQSHEEKRIGDEMIDKVSRMLKENLDPDEVDATCTIPDTVMKKLAELGLFALKVPKEYGGLGFSQVNFNRVMSAIATYCGSTMVLLSAHQSIGVPEPLKMHGTEEQKKKFFPMFRDGAISAFALTEPDVGSDPANLSTSATPTDDGEFFILNGDKLWCTNGPIADLIVVMALTPPKIIDGKERKQITAFIVETKTPGVEVLHRCDFLGIRGIQNGLLRFKNVKVPKENMIWKPGKGLALALATLNTGRLTVPAGCIGLARACLHIARKWGNERVQWGQPVGYHEEGRKKMALFASSAFAIEAITHLTSHWADLKNIDIRIEAAMAKYYCSELSWKLVDTLLQFRGGRGYETAQSLKGRGEEPIPVERMLRDTRINLIIEGSSEIMRLFLAREALDPHLKRLMSLIKGGASPGKIMNMLGFYSLWYPKQWINGSFFSRHGDAGNLGTHLRFVEQSSHRLARSIFHKMARYQKSLENKQMILGRLVDIGTELFAIAATCSYAIAKEKEGQKEARELARHFCVLAERRVRDHFKALSDNDDAINNELAKSVLEGQYQWLEEGIIGVDLGMR